MKLFIQILLRLLAVSLVGLVLWLYVVNISPYQTDGALNNLNILIALTLLSLFMFVLLRFICLFFTQRLANRIAFLGSLGLIQLFFISGDLGILNVISLTIIIAFNAFLVWGAIKIL